MHFSPGRSWLTGVTLSGMLLAGSAFLPPASRPLLVHPVKTPVILASADLSAGEIGSLNQQLLQNTVKPAAVTTPVKAKHAPTEKSQQATASPAKSSRQAAASPAKSSRQAATSPVRSSRPANPAQLPSRKNLPEIAQASRGGSETTTVVDRALSLLGTRYVFGGTTTSGFDCSGFTQYVFAHSGISIPRSSYAQFDSGVPVSRNDLQPGDLVFFSTYAEGASHVGIYIGGGRFIQADNPKVGVTITNLSNSFYSSRYLGARRYK